MLELKHITKDFPGVRALDDVSLIFKPGEIHALLGENGAGKSTMMKIICGIYPDYAGVVTLNGTELKLTDYQDAINKGISIVPQEIQTISEASVAENIVLDKLPRYRTKVGTIDWTRLNREASEFMATVNLDVSPTAPIGPLSAAQKQLSQIAKALSADASVLLLDEPTSSITKHEAETLFQIMSRLRDDGKIIIFVSHKLEEIFRICDKVSVIRDGRHVGTSAVKDIDRDAVVEMMVGREVRDEHLGILEPQKDDIVLEVRGLNRTGKVENIHFRLGRGEILGFYGLVGAGRTETARLIIGEDHPDSGEIIVNGKPVQIRNVANALYEHRIGYITENRKEEGLLLDFDLETNVTMTIWSRIINKITRSISGKRQRLIADEVVKNLDIKATGLDQEVRKLSGGNQQKASIAKWLVADCDILIIDEPTVGVDVGAKEYIHRLVWSLAKDHHKSIILISSDLPEMIKIARRILVFKNKNIVGEFDDLTGLPSDSDELSRQIGALLI